MAEQRKTEQWQPSQPIVTFKGFSGIQNTRPFTISSPWELVWRTRGTENSKAMTIGIYTLDGKISDYAGNESGSGRSYQPKGGTFYLNIYGTGDWEVSVVPIRE